MTRIEAAGIINAIKCSMVTTLKEHEALTMAECVLFEAEPRKRGKWKVVPELESWNIVYCSECGEGMWNAKGDALPYYCYNCGAKMDEERREDEENRC